MIIRAANWTSIKAHGKSSNNLPANDQKTAREFYKKLVGLSERSDGDRAEVRRIQTLNKR